MDVVVDEGRLKNDLTWGLVWGLDFGVGLGVSLGVSLMRGTGWDGAFFC